MIWSEKLKVLHNSSSIISVKTIIKNFHIFFQRYWSSFSFEINMCAHIHIHCMQNTWKFYEMILTFNAHDAADILFYSILLYSILFYSILSDSILFYSTLFHSIPFLCILVLIYSYSIPFFFEGTLVLTPLNASVVQ